MVGDLDSLLAALDRVVQSTAGAAQLDLALGLNLQQASGGPAHGKVELREVEGAEASLLACEGCSPAQEASLEQLLRRLRGRRCQQQGRGGGREAEMAPAPRLGRLYSEGVLLGTMGDDFLAAAEVADAMYYI